MSQRLNHYRVDEVIGVGSFATVYRAVDERLDAPVVLKVLAENHSLNPEIRERFIGEARSLRRVQGSHVVTIHDIGESERQQPYLVLEFADRGTLQQRVSQLRRAGWKAGPEDLLAFARSLAAAVDAVHRAHLVHRDLSPGNLLLAVKPTSLMGDASSGMRSAVIRADERLLIADLGMCKDLAVNSGLTVSGGTAGFRPPEQDGPGMVDIRADIWAMSALLAWLVQDSETPAALTKVLKRGMATKPQRRQSDAETWLNEVEGALKPPEPEPAPEPDLPPADAVGANTAAPDRREVNTSSHTARLGPRRASTWRRSLFMILLGISVVGGLMLGRWIFGDDAELPAQTEDASIAISGPEQVQVGEETAFTAEVEGLSSWVWILPNGRHLADEEQVSITATSPGLGEVVLRSVTPSGEELEVRREIRVVE